MSQMMVRLLVRQLSMLAFLLCVHDVFQKEETGSHIARNGLLPSYLDLRELGLQECANTLRFMGKHSITPNLK